MNSQRRLGRGLEALLGRPAVVVATAPNDEAVPAIGLVQIAVHDIDENPFQPRQTFDQAAITELAESLQEHGLLQPLVVRRFGERYQLISGDRRLRAAIHAGWSHVPAQVREADDRQVAELAIVENLQRKDLDPLEKAASFERYLERFGCTQEELASRLKIDRSTVANLIRLLELPEAVQQALRRGAITQGHARAMLPLGDESEQLTLCKRIETEALSVRATEEMVQQMIHHADAEPLAVVTRDGRRTRAKRTRNEHLATLEQELRAALGTRVELRQTATGRGKIVIHFAGHAEFERLQRQLCDHSSQTPTLRSA